MELFEHVRKSIYNPEYYEEIESKPFSYSIKYFYSLVLVMAVILSTVYGFIFIPVTVSFLKSFGTAIVDYYPSELTVTIKGGMVTTNVTEPYSLPFPEKLRSSETKGIDNLLVIDTHHDFTMDLWNQYKTTAWLTKDTLIYRDKDNRISITPLDKTPNTEITRTKIASWLAAIEPFFKWVPPLLIFGIFVFFMFFLSGYLFYLLFGALLIYFIARLKKIPLSYKKAYQVGLHAITLSLIFTLAKLSLLQGSPNIPFLFTAVLCIVAWINLKKKEESTTTEPLPKA